VYVNASLRFYTALYSFIFGYLILFDILFCYCGMAILVSYWIIRCVCVGCWQGVG
jgi:hypothetical protein